jgi:type I restriction enzyme S subunit
MELKPGYKQTEVGVIPEDWNVELVRTAYEIRNNLRLPLSENIRKGMQGMYPYYGPTKIQDYINEYRVEGEYCLIGEDGDHFLKWKEIPMTLLARGKFNVNNHAHLVCGIRNETLWFFYYFSNRDITKHLTRQGAGRYKLTKTSLQNIPLAIPPTKTEQTAIANALGDGDGLIQSLTSLIAKKHQIKQGAMQTLLNPYENGQLKAGWVVKKLGEISDLLTGFPFSSLGYTNEGIRLLRGSNIKRGQTDWNDEITKCWPSMTSDIRRYELLEGDIVVAMDGSLVGRSFAQLKQSDLPALLLQRVARIRSKSESFNINYIKEWVCSEIFTKHCDSLKTVTAIPHISPADIYNFVLNVPERKEEQTRIAAILSDMDAEIAALETKLAKYRYIKQGMMQNLLTGKIRLI